MQIQSLIRTIPDFPKPGILFRDITTLFNHAEGFNEVINQLAKQYNSRTITQIAGIEARGFVIGAALAYRLNTGFIPLRKPGKLPGKLFSQAYELEYGTDELHIHADAIDKHDKVLLIDDLIATGGTAEAAIKLIRKTGSALVGCAFIVELPDLGGRKKIEQLDCDVFSLCQFPGH